MWSPANPEPPTELLADFVSIYRQKLYFQPLPLFDPRNLQDELRSAPHFLRWSFLALALHHVSPSFYYGLESKAIEYYTTSARSIAVDMAAEGVAKLETLQALCLIALCEHMAGKPERAWMTIGIAARLEALRLSNLKTPPRSSHADDASSRCHYSIVILESTFSPHSSTLIDASRAPSYPRSVPQPPPLHSWHGMKSYCADLTDAYEGDIDDAGITACCLSYICFWGSTISYLQDIRYGSVEYPWLTTSRHNQLTVKLYELENDTSHRHLIRNAPFPDQATSHLNDYREYWAPWVLMQITMHAAQATLNNPFVQLVALRRAGSKFQPRSFLQVTVDQALFHSGWVARLVQMCQDRAFEVNDPLIGQAVAACASILWIFQFARDPKVSEKARENLSICEVFLGRLSRKWPHIARKVEILRALNVKVATQTSQQDETNTTIRFEPELIWGLLDPTQSISHCTNTAIEEQDDDPASSTTIQVATKFIHPIDEEQEKAPAPHATQSLFDLEDIYGEPFLDQFFSDSLLVNVT
ncbi:hypothetical protein FZEAL_3381 [Fusarium zealandicum]|uniref:Xylanolytic transcriptional activator regulatory domain-containing protein n=1 Tax=Fusarium zealandicum TaxID=1053134 RepID=A0A8H4UPM0_9HYPO|nr:hypothetical protein FZEAL_3381 [Fusarium zealandicum]